MPGLKPMEPMYSLWYSEGDCYGLEENNRDKELDLLHTHTQKKKSLPRVSLNMVKTLWKVWLGSLLLVGYLSFHRNVCAAFVNIF